MGLIVVFGIALNVTDRLLTAGTVVDSVIVGLALGLTVPV